MIETRQALIAKLTEWADGMRLAPPPNMPPGMEPLVEEMKAACQHVADRQQLLYEVIDALAAEPPASVHTCAWVRDEDEGSWDTACGEKWILLEGTPKANGMHYCPYCGGTLQQVNEVWR